MNKAYEPKKYEEEILQKWADAKISEPETKEKFLEKDGKKLSDKNFCIPIPPPNVTGQLHLGHAMMLVIQDIMTRYHRMNGTSSLWLPGTDHAAIATETVVLKNLGVASREVFTRPEFLEKCFEHTTKTHATITNQVQKMGATCDFSRERFTMDLGMSNAVQKIFSDLYKQDLIVRGHRMVNWSTGAQSVLADDELEYEDQKDTFAYIKCGKFVMGTVRSETKCANSPLVLHPTENYVKATFEGQEYIFSEVLFDDEDRRNKIFNCLGEGKWEKISTHQGKEFEGEKFTAETYSGQREFFVLCDDEVIDINKGTGAMTISVCHSADDYLLAKKYPEILKDYYYEKIDFSGKMTKLAGELEGVEVKIARKRAFKIMKEKGLIVGAELGYEHNVPLCYRTGCVVEPMISPQWFIDVNKQFDWQEGVGVVENVGAMINRPETYLQNIEDMLKTEKKTKKQLSEKKYSNQKQWEVGEVSSEIQNALEIETPVIFLSETVYAKVRGWITEKPGHINRIDADFWLLPVILQNIYKVYENKHMHKRVILCECNKKSYVLVLDISKKSSPIIVSFFYTDHAQSYSNNSKLYKKRYLGEPANVSPCIISKLRKDLIGLAAGFSSRKIPVYKQINEFLQESQEQVFPTKQGDHKGTPLQDTNPILRKSLKQLTSEAINRDETPAGNFKTNSGNKIDLVPKRFNKIYDQWIDNLQDWCISRQIWWGHQIPIWYDEDNNQHVAREQKLLFTRHGESENNVKQLICGDTPLTKKGQQQARDLAKKLISEKRTITKIILSPLERATETGHIIQKILEENSGTKISVETWDFLREFSAGKYDNTPALKNGEKILGKMIAENEGDSVETLISRAKKFWEKISETENTEISGNKNKELGAILIVSHQATTNFIFAVKDGATENNLLEHRQRWSMENCEVKESLWMVKPVVYEKTPENSEYSDSLQNIEKLLQTEKKEKLYEKNNFYTVGKLSTEMQISLNTSASVHISEFIYAKIKGWIPQLAGHNKIENSDFYLLPYFLEHATEVYENAEKNERYLIAHAPLDTQSVVIVIDTKKNHNEIVSYFFVSNSEKYLKSLVEKQRYHKKRSLEGPTAPSCIISQLRKDAKRLVVGFPSRQTPIYKDFNKFFTDIQEQNICPTKNRKKAILRQDENTLDTWFSSALWPFSTLGWPDKTPDFEKFFPTSVLETGHDILFFWVARMIMFSRFTTGKNPFSEVFLHGLVCDEHGKKMSKSKGNGIDPLKMIEKFGTDAVRMSLIVGTTPGNQVNLGEKKIEGFRNFANKLWNVSRYILALESSNRSEGVINQAPTNTENLSLPEKWILSKTQKLISEVSEGIEAHKYGEVGQKLYDFTWNDVADWAIESAKSVDPENSHNIGHTLREVLITLLKLLHPYIPFVTEQIWEEMGNTTVLALENFPEISEDLKDEQAEEKFLILQNVIGKIRSLRSASKVDPVKKITAILKGENIEFLKENQDTIILMGRLETLEFSGNSGENSEISGESVNDIINGTEIILPLSGMIDEEEEKKRKSKELEDAKKMLKNLEGRISNKKYMDNAPEKLVTQTMAQYEEIKEKIRILEG